MLASSFETPSAAAVSRRSLLSFSPAEWPNSTNRAMDVESLTSEVVAEGIRSAPPDADDLHRRVVDRVEKELIIQVLANCNQVQTKTATKLGINRNTLHKKLKDYGLDDQTAAE
jgi:DNA-binding NtrC family response regulator